MHGLGLEAGAFVELYAPDGATRIDSVSVHGGSSAPSTLNFEVQSTAVYFVRMANADPSTTGNETGYLVVIRRAEPEFIIPSMIVGTIQDAQTLQHVERASIKVVDNPQIPIEQDEVGVFLIGPLPPALYSIEASSGDGNYGPEVLNVVVSKGGVTVVDFLIDPAFLLEVLPLSADYGDVTVGDSVVHGFTVRNAGTGTLGGTAAVLDGAPQFRVLDNAQYSLGENESVEVVIEFAPDAVHSFGGTIEFGGGSGKTIDLTGVGKTAPSVAVTPSFSTLPAGAGTAVFEIAITEDPDTQWTATVTDGAGWLCITGNEPPNCTVASGSGTGVFQLNVAYTASDTFVARVGSIEVTAQLPGGSVLVRGSPFSVMVTQDGVLPNTIAGTVLNPIPQLI